MVLLCFSLGMVYFASLLVILFVHLFQITLLVVFMMYVFIGRICLVQWRSLCVNVLFVRQIKVVPKSLVGCLNLLRIQVLLSNM